ncbi:MAG: glycosyltransferase family protein [Alphaproteobacteria bacterium]
MKHISDGWRILIYSHDTFGLGHLRRCRAIAHALVEANKHLSVLILSGSPIIGSFDFRARVDFVRIPGVIKLRKGEYTSLNLHIDIEQTLAMRASIIQHTANIFAPHIFIVDKEPLGLRGEVKDTLVMLKERGTQLVLGLRDVLDEPGLLRPEWQRKNVLPALLDLYDDVWVYGLSQIFDPLAELALPPAVDEKTTFTGYLPRHVPAHAPSSIATTELDEPYLLVTAGGGGDGDGLMDWVLRAYECDAPPPLNALLVFGPFMQPELQARFQARVNRLPQVKAIVFDTYIEGLMERAAGVVAMGGYNTFCEILSLDKRALIVPRRAPRLEQYVRASRARDLGLVSMLIDNGQRDAKVMATALAQLPRRPPPSEVVIPGLLDGFVNFNRLIAARLDDHYHPARLARVGQSG